MDRLSEQDQARYNTLLARWRYGEHLPEGEYRWMLSILKARHAWAQRQSILNRMEARRLGLSLYSLRNTQQGLNTTK